jgi:hypothetical protein
MDGVGKQRPRSDPEAVGSFIKVCGRDELPLVLTGFSIRQPGCNSDLAQYSNTPPLSTACFEDEDEAFAT